MARLEERLQSDELTIFLRLDPAAEAASFSPCGDPPRYPSPPRYEAALNKRLVPTGGKKRALVALANSTLQAVWHMLSKHQTYIDLGGDYFEARQKEELTRSLVKRLGKLGHKVTIEQVAA